MVNRVSKHCFSAFKLILLSMLLAACSKEGPERETREFPNRQNPPSIGYTDFIQIAEPLHAQIGCDESSSISLASYDPDVVIDPATCFEDAEGNRSELVDSPNPNRIANSSERIIVDLDTELDNMAKAEVSVMASQRVVTVTDHETGGRLVLLKSPEPVCEIIPAERVITTSLNAGASVVHKVIHEKFVYVVTASDGTINACTNVDAFRRYQKVPLNYQPLAPLSDVCLSETGGQSDAEDCFVKTAPYVSEAEARSELVFGWVDDENPVAPGDQRLTYGYLGYGDSFAVGTSAHALEFRDQNRNLLWYQIRALQEFEQTVSADNKLSSAYFYELTELNDQQYLLQFGRDIFVFDSSSELFAKKQTSSAEVLRDRIFKMDAVTSAIALENIAALNFAFNSQDLVIEDASKVYLYDYKTAYVAPQTSVTYAVSRAPLLFNNQSLQAMRPFSQHDQSACDINPDTAACDIAHDLDTPSWTLITDCTVALGCELIVDTTDYCVSPAEQTGSTLESEKCTPARYQDLNELDKAANNAEFRGFMQYGEDFFRFTDIQLYDNSLLVTARMLNKDILVRYFYNEDLSAPKANRELVILGERLKHGAIETFVDEGGLLINTLVSNSTSTICYRGYVRADCQLNDLVSEGAGSICTGKDVVDGQCTSNYNEYESQALYCSDAQVLAGSCEDNSLIPNNTLNIEADDEDAKWLRVEDYTAYDSNDSSTAQHRYMLMVSKARLEENAQAPDFGYVAAEGVLGNPELYEVADVSTGTLGASLGQLMGRVESTGYARVYPSAANGELGRISVTADELAFVSGTPQSSASEYFLVTPGSGEVNKVADFMYQRPRTR